MIDKEKLFSWIDQFTKSLQEQETKLFSEKEYNMAARMNAKKLCVIYVKEQIESGMFNKELTS